MNNLNAINLEVFYVAKKFYKETSVYEKLYGKPKKYQYYPIKFRIYPSNEIANGIISIIKTTNSFVKTFFKFIFRNEVLYEKSIRLIESLNNHPDLACVILLREMVKDFKEQCKSGKLNQEEYAIKSLFVFNYDDLPSAHIEYIFKNIGMEYLKFYKKHGRCFENIEEDFKSQYMDDLNWIYCRDKSGLYFYDIGKDICYIKLPKLGTINKNVKDLYEVEGLDDKAVLPVAFVSIDEDANTKELLFFISFAVRPEDVKTSFKRDVSEVSLVFTGKYFTNVQVFFPKVDSKMDGIDGFDKEIYSVNPLIYDQFENDLVGKSRYLDYRKYFESNILIQAYLDYLKSTILNLDPEVVSILNITTAFDFIKDQDNIISVNLLFYINEYLEELSLEYGFKIKKFDEMEAEFYYCLDCDERLASFNDNDRGNIDNQSLFSYLSKINNETDEDEIRTGCHSLEGCGTSFKLTNHVGIKLIKLAFLLKEKNKKKSKK